MRAGKEDEACSSIHLATFTDPAVPHNPIPIARSKGLFRPRLRVQDFLPVHLPIVAVCYMYMQDSLSWHQDERPTAQAKNYFRFSPSMQE
jgi:hypothetical protein